MAGYDAKVIARWDVVPYQTFTGDFNVGVVAFHMNGVEKVDFSVNGGPWASVTEMKLNPQTNVREYTTTLHASDFTDGWVEVRAIAWPVGAGKARLLAGEYDVSRAYGGTQWTGEHSLVFFANSGNSLDVENVDLPAGDYIWGQAPLFYGTQRNQQTWLTYRPAPGVAREQVRIVGGATLSPRERNFAKIRLQNITIQGHAGFLGWFNNAQNKMLWLDHVVVNGPGQYDPSGNEASTPHQWWTDCTVADSRFGMARQFVRNCQFGRIGEDVIRYHHTVINCTIDGVDSGPTAWHSGVFANPYSNDNRIYYGNTIRNLGNSVAWPFRNGTDIHWQNYDVAIVNCVTEASHTPNVTGWFVGGDTRNMFVKNCSFGGAALWRQAGAGVQSYWVFSGRDVVIENTTWNGSAATHPLPYPISGVQYRSSP